MKLKIYKKDILTECDLCKSGGEKCDIAVTDEGDVYVICKKCIACLSKLIEIEIPTKMPSPQVAEATAKTETEESES